MRRRSRLRRYAKTDGLFGLQPQSHRTWRRILDILGHYCLKCGRAPVTRDHIVPLCRGGLNHPANLQPLCKDCNRRKGSAIVDWRSPEQRSAILQRWPLTGLAAPEAPITQ